MCEGRANALISTVGVCRRSTLGKRSNEMQQGKGCRGHREGLWRLDSCPSGYALLAPPRSAGIPCVWMQNTGLKNVKAPRFPSRIFINSAHHKQWAKRTELLCKGQAVPARLPPADGEQDGLHPGKLFPRSVLLAITLSCIIVFHSTVVGSGPEPVAVADTQLPLHWRPLAPLPSHATLPHCPGQAQCQEPARRAVALSAALSRSMQGATMSAPQPLLTYLLNPSPH